MSSRDCCLNGLRWSSTSFLTTSGNPGSSCPSAMEERRITLDILHHLGFERLDDVWDLASFYDTIDFKVLLQELDGNDDRHRKAAPTMMVHASRMFLKLGKVSSGMVTIRGRCIVAGCARSNGMAKAYTQSQKAGRNRARMRQ